MIVLAPQPLHLARETASPTVSGGLGDASSSATRIGAFRPHLHSSLIRCFGIEVRRVPPLFTLWTIGQE